MSEQSGSKPNNLRPVASNSASVISEVALLDRLAILASILLSLEQSTVAGAAEQAAVDPTLSDELGAADTSASPERVGEAPVVIELAALPETASPDNSIADGTKASIALQRVAAEAGADPMLPLLAAQADAAVKPTLRLGSSTSPVLLKIDGVNEQAGPGPLSLEKLIVATPHSDVIVSSIPATTFVFTGAAGPDNFDSFIATGHGNTVDFSGLSNLVIPANSELLGPGVEIKHDASAANGVFVDLTADTQTVATASGPVTVQAWQLDGDGKAVMPLAHLENIDNVTGTVGNDVVIGNDNANLFTYTAADGSDSGQHASYGFDIYYGGPNQAAEGTADVGDTVDFSRLGTQESNAGSGAGEQTLLPFDAKGITLDLEHSVTISTTDPMTGEATTVTGTLVSTTGGSEQTDLALLAWTAVADGNEGHSSIENIVTTGGADAIWGNDADNVIVVRGAGENGPAFIDGRSGSDTIDFSQLSLGNNAGIEIHLNGATDSVVDPTGGAQSDVIQVSVLPSDGEKSSTDTATPLADVKNVENVVGTSGNDIIEGNANDNILVGGGGSDQFVFGDVAVVDGRGVTNIGHDIIKDFNHSGLDDSDYLVFDSRIFNFHDGSSLDWLQQLLSSNQIRDESEGLIIWIDENNSITLQNYDLHDDSGHGLGLSAYSSWIVFV